VPRAFTYLTDLPLFDCLADDEAALLARGAYRRVVPPGGAVRLEGQPATALGAVASGLVKAVLLRPDGREIFLALYRPGDCFGAEDLAGVPEHACSVAAVSRSELLFFPLETVRTLLGRNPELALRVLELVSRNLRRVQDRLRDVLSERGDGRVLKYLEQLAEPAGAAGAGLLVREPPSHQVIADACGLARESVTRLLRRLERAGRLVRTARGWLLPPAPSVLP
jgi:CRP-like cAMP-binding protein